MQVVQGLLYGGLRLGNTIWDADAAVTGAGQENSWEFFRQFLFYGLQPAQVTNSVLGHRFYPTRYAGEHRLRRDADEFGKLLPDTANHLCVIQVQAFFLSGASDKAP